MNTNLAVVVGDPHLSERTWASHRSLTGDSLYSFWQAVEIAKEHELPMVLLGDIFDSKSVSSAVLQFFCSCMDNLQRHRIPVYYIQGNHDIVTPPWPDVHSWPQHIHRERIQLEDVPTGDVLRCYGLDWAPVANYAEQLAEIPADVDVLFTHQAWYEFGKMGSSATAECAMLPRGMHVLTGDLHIPMAANGTAANGATVHLLSPGALCLQAINEPQHHYVYILQKTLAGDVTVLPVSLHTRKVYEFVCGTQEEFDRHVAQIAVLQKTAAANARPNAPYDISAPIVRVTYPLTISQDSYMRLQAATDRSGSHLFTSPRMEEAAVSQIDVEAVQAPTLLTLADAIAMLTEEAQSVRDLAARVLSEAENLLPFLTKFNAEYMGVAECKSTQSN